MPNSCRLHATCPVSHSHFHTRVATEKLITTIMPRYSICCSANFLGPSLETLGKLTDQPLTHTKYTVRINGTMRALSTTEQGWEAYAECAY